MMLVYLTSTMVSVSRETVVRFWNEFGSSKEAVEAILFKDRNVENRVQNLIIL